MLNSYCSCVNEILKIWNYCTHFEIMYFVVVFIVLISVVSVTVTVDVSVDVGYCNFSNSSANIFCTVITVNIAAYIYVTTVNVTKYVIVLVSVIIGVNDGGDGGGWYILLTVFMLHWLITFTMTSFTDSFTVIYDKKWSKQISQKKGRDGQLKRSYFKYIMVRLLLKNGEDKKYVITKTISSHGIIIYIIIHS